MWTDLVGHAAKLEPAMLNLAFVFLLLGYGTKIGLFPLHAWLPDAHAEGPTPITAVLSGLLLNVALYALLRCKMLLAGNPEALAPGPLMIGMGLVSLLFGAFMLYRRRDIKRLFAYSSIEHMGLITFAFGLGGPIANFAGLLHMALHSLTKSGIFFAVGDISQVKGTQKIADMAPCEANLVRCMPGSMRPISVPSANNRFDPNPTMREIPPEQSLIQYPSAFPIKVMSQASPSGGKRI